MLHCTEGVCRPWNRQHMASVRSRHFGALRCIHLPQRQWEFKSILFLVQIECAKVAYVMCFSGCLCELWISQQLLPTQLVLARAELRECYSCHVDFQPPFLQRKRHNLDIVILGIVLSLCYQIECPKQTAKKCQNDSADMASTGINTNFCEHVVCRFILLRCFFRSQAIQAPDY